MFNSSTAVFVFSHQRSSSREGGSSPPAGSSRSCDRLILLARCRNKVLIFTAPFEWSQGEHASGRRPSPFDRSSPPCRRFKAGGPPDVIRTRGMRARGKSRQVRQSWPRTQVVRGHPVAFVCLDFGPARRSPSAIRSAG